MTAEMTSMNIPSKRERFREAAAEGAFFLETDASSLQAYLTHRGWLTGGESVLGAKIAGQGNMNFIVRVTTDTRSFILKQSRPWVEKYPDIFAPFGRALVEADFYALVSSSPAAEFMPEFRWLDRDSRILCLEDLGPFGDFTHLYSGSRIQATEVETLARFLSLLHRTPGQLENREMRLLNHFHIFVFPFEPANHFDLDSLTPGLELLSNEVKGNQKLRTRVAILGDLYLSEGDFLLHGDYFPGAWLRSWSGVKIIDPEFGFSGPREFDLGVMLAHLRLIGESDALETLARCYAQWSDLDQELVWGFAGVEVLRRLLGVAQLPLSRDLNQKRLLVGEAISMVIG